MGELLDLVDIYTTGELMPTDRNECGELLFTPVFVNDSGEYVHVG